MNNGLGSSYENKGISFTVNFFNDLQTLLNVDDLFSFALRVIFHFSCRLSNFQFRRWWSNSLVKLSFSFSLQWASVASWFFRPDAPHPPFPPAPLAANLPNIRGSSPRPTNPRSNSEHSRHFAMAPTICTVCLIYYLIFFFFFIFFCRVFMLHVVKNVERCFCDRRSQLEIFA